MKCGSSGSCNGDFMLADMMPADAHRWPFTAIKPLPPPGHLLFVKCESAAM